MPSSDLWVRPSIVRDYIASLYKTRNVPEPPGSTWDQGHHASLAGLVELIDHMDWRVVVDTMPPPRIVEWTVSIAALRAAFTRWQGIGAPTYGLGQIRGLDADPVSTIYRILTACPEELAQLSQPRLTFVRDKALRESIGRDIASLDAFFRTAEWKGLTVIGGSVIEALLLDALMKRKYKQKALAEEARRVAAREPRWKAEALEKWDLWKLIEVSQAIRILDLEVASVCTGARHFRNLIHPGRERLKYACDRGTAFAVRGAVEQVVRSLGGRMP
jgi:hypothetical protein